MEKIRAFVCVVMFCDCNKKAARGAIASPIFGRSVNPIQTRAGVANYAYHITTGTADFWTVQRLCYLYTQKVNFKTEVTWVIKSIMNYKVCNLKGFQAHYIGFKKGKTDRS